MNSLLSSKWNWCSSREQKKRADEAREKQTERRREAMNAQEVLRSLVEQIKEREGAQGLIILEALYGYLLSRTAESSIKIIDVTIPLQTLVKNSTLKIETTVSKSNLTGFYDPCVGEEKSLFIKYSFRSQIHTVTYKDTDPVILPNRGKSGFRKYDPSRILFRSSNLLKLCLVVTSKLNFWLFFMSWIPRLRVCVVSI